MAVTECLVAVQHFIHRIFRRMVVESLTGTSGIVIRVLGSGTSTGLG
jgi:hypothetical protein